MYQSHYKGRSKGAEDQGDETEPEISQSSQGSSTNRSATDVRATVEAHVQGMPPPNASANKKGEWGAGLLQNVASLMHSARAQKALRTYTDLYHKQTANLKEHLEKHLWTLD